MNKYYTNILVTGGAGYIGSACVQELLRQGYKVTIFDNLEYGYKHNVDFQKCELIVGDLRDYRSILNAMQRIKPDAVIHFAAYALVGESCADPLKYYNNNVTGGINLLMAMENVGCHRLIFSSTCATYGIPAEQSLIDGKIDENTIQKPINPYGSSKYVFEQIIKQYSQHKIFNYTIFRYFNACGATDTTGEEHVPETHLIPNVINTAYSSTMNLEVFGDDYNTDDGTCVRDYIHIKDLATAHVMALNDNVYGEFNLGTGKGTSVKEIITKVSEITEKDIQYKISSRRPGDPDKLIANPRKANEILKWYSKYNVNDAINDAVNFKLK